jgi:hypothetical protein
MSNPEFTSTEGEFRELELTLPKSAAVVFQSVMAHALPSLNSIPEELEADDSLADRMAANNNAVEMYRDAPHEHWGFGEGDYSYHAFYDGQQTDLNYRLPQFETITLMGKEEVFASRIRTLLELQLDRPVIAADIGGMYGVSFLRLSHVFRAEIAQERLVLLVTNVNHDPDKVEITEEVFRDEVNHYIPIVAESKLAKHDKRVHYVNALPSELSGQSIVLPSGREMQISEIDIIHERLAIAAHSFIPDREVTTLLHMLSSQGIFIGEKYTHPKHDRQNQRNTERAWNKFLRRLDHARDFSKVDKIQTGDSVKSSINDSFLVVQRKGALKIGV